MCSATLFAKSAAETGTEDRVLYPAQFYAPYSPHTVLDMLNRTPGFVFDEGSMVRGFAEGAGNVLLDGTRPSVKADALADLLARIPAAQVERVEIIRGGVHSEAPGQHSVANIVRRAQADRGGSLEVLVERAPHGRVFPNVSGSLSHQGLQWHWSLAAAAQLEYHPYDSVFGDYNEADQIEVYGEESFPGRYSDASLSSSLTGPLAAGQLALNLRYAGEQDLAQEFRSGYYTPDTAAPDFHSQLDLDEVIHRIELGGDWTRQLESGRELKLIALTSTDWLSNEQQETLEESDFSERSYSDLNQQGMEAVLRAAVSGNTRSLGHEFGAELAWNRLTSDLDYFQNEGNGPEPIELPAAHVRATELRGEIFASASRQLSQLQLEAGFALELSRIEVSGDTANSDQFAYFKPALAATWRLSSQTQWRLAYRHSVGQLSFGDFAASVDGLDDREVGGNPGLRPDQTRRLSLGLDRRYGEGGALAAEIWHQWREDVLEYVPLEAGGQGIGNVPRARDWGISARWSQPLDRIIPGAEIHLDGMLGNSTLADPVTGESRPISGSEPFGYGAEFRHDVPGWQSAWGIYFEGATRTDFYFVDEHVRERTENIWSVYVESTRFASMKARLELYGLDDQRQSRQREFFDNDRTGTFAGSERRKSEVGGMYIIFSLSRSF